jgi:LmbE family N-acetylglucosaminyl deacetylase
MKQLTLLLILSTLILTSCKKEEESQKVILVIFAHPDDETTIGPMMAKYAKQNKVIYIVATDGRYGVRTNKISEDSLIKIRKAECECSARALGIDSPILLGFHDGFGIRTGIGEYFDQTGDLKKRLKSKIEELNPDFILTFGPDGDTGHSDHRIIGDIITEIILREGWVDKFPLYYLGWTKEQASKFGIQELSYVDPKYFNVSISFSQEDENKYFESIRCYQSQYTQEEIEEWISTDLKDTSNILYFRKLSVDKGAKSEFNN